MTHEGRQIAALILIASAILCGLGVVALGDEAFSCAAIAVGGVLFLLCLYLIIDGLPRRPQESQESSDEP